MELPKYHLDLLEQGIITGKSLQLALYSVNKRAKNWRDWEDLIWKKIMDDGWKDKYNDLVRAECMKCNYYDLKAMLLELLEPYEIHIISFGYGFDEYMLCYRLGNRYFHNPMTDEDLKKYRKKLKQVYIKKRKGLGRSTYDLLDLEHVSMVCVTVLNGNYKLQLDDFT